MIQPTEADIEAAKAYLRLRLEAERSMSYNLEIVMREAAERIVAIIYSDIGLSPGERFVSVYEPPARLMPQINEVVDWLRETIDDYFLTLAIYDHEENRDKILPFIFGLNHGQTFDERLTDYCTKYHDELLLLVGAGLFLGIGKTALAKSIGSHLKQPYKNPDLVDGIAAPLTYGRGHTNSMFTAINTLTTFGIGRGWMYDRHLKAEMESAQGFMTFRNSSWPCDICDEYASYPHPMDDEIPPIHANCVCGTVYFNAYGEFIRL